MRENMAEILIRGICQHMHSPREFATCRSIHNNLEIKKMMSKINSLVYVYVYILMKHTNYIFRIDCYQNGRTVLLEME